MCGLIGLLLIGGCHGGEKRNGSAPSQADANLSSEADANQSRGVRGTVPPFGRQPGEFLTLVLPKRPPKEIELVSLPVVDVPVIDGRADDRVWDRAPVVTTLDFASQREITLRSVHTSERIFFLVTYPDGAPSETHKSWGWDATEKVYKQLPDREDMLVLKWSMVGNGVNLAFRNPEPHRADIWFWKAHRTNPSGYADDKWQRLSLEPHRRAKVIQSPSYGSLYLMRMGDAGQSAYKDSLIFEYQGDVVPRFSPRSPQGSRADIRAKGRWHDGKWTIELARKLDTGHDDDIVFVPGGRYLFAVSCYEMAHSKVNPTWAQPLYRSGDAFDRLFLNVAKAG
jgi:hypothetical protein